MSRSALAAVSSGPTTHVGGGDYRLVVLVLAVAVLALVFALVLVREVLAAGEGSEKMQEIARAVQEGAAAYLTRQFRTVAGFVVLVFLLLLLLPASGGGVRIGRSVAFVVGALFSGTAATIGALLLRTARQSAEAQDGSAINSRTPAEVA